MNDTARRAQIARDTCPFLTTKQAAFHLGLSVDGLTKLRLEGRGPAWRRHGRTYRYHLDDIEAWSGAQRGGGRA